MHTTGHSLWGSFSGTGCLLPSPGPRGAPLASSWHLPGPCPTHSSTAGAPEAGLRPAGSHAGPQCRLRDPWDGLEAPKQTSGPSELDSTLQGSMGTPGRRPEPPGQDSSPPGRRGDSWAVSRTPGAGPKSLRLDVGSPWTASGTPQSRSPVPRAEVGTPGRRPGPSEQVSSPQGRRGDPPGRCPGLPRGNASLQGRREDPRAASGTPRAALEPPKQTWVPWVASGTPRAGLMPPGQTWGLLGGVRDPHVGTPGSRADVETPGRCPGPPGLDSSPQGRRGDPGAAFGIPGIEVKPPRRRSGPSQSDLDSTQRGTG